MAERRVVRATPDFFPRTAEGNASFDRLAERAAVRDKPISLQAGLAQLPTRHTAVSLQPGSRRGSGRFGSHVTRSW